MASFRAIVTGAVEGLVDEVVVRRLLAEVGAQAGTVYGKNGKVQLQHRIPGFNQAARQAPWFVLTDLDHDAACAPALKRIWLPEPAPMMCFRIAVHEVESWLLADRAGIASFLGIAVARIPSDPDALDDPKRALVDLARRSPRRDIREDMIPRPGSGRSVGPAYSSRLIEFVSGPKAEWRPSVAAKRSLSLLGCLEALHKLID